MLCCFCSDTTTRCWLDPVVPSLWWIDRRMDGWLSAWLVGGCMHKQTNRQTHKNTTEWLMSVCVCEWRERACAKYMMLLLLFYMGMGLLFNVFDFMYKTNERTNGRTVGWARQTKYKWRATHQHHHRHTTPHGLLAGGCLAWLAGWLPGWWWCRCCCFSTIHDGASQVCLPFCCFFSVSFSFVSFADSALKLSGRVFCK